MPCKCHVNLLKYRLLQGFPTPCQLEKMNSSFKMKNMMYNFLALMVIGERFSRVPAANIFPLESLLIDVKTTCANLVGDGSKLSSEMFNFQLDGY